MHETAKLSTLQLLHVVKQNDDLYEGTLGGARRDHPQGPRGSARERDLQHVLLVPALLVLPRIPPSSQTPGACPMR